mmetsp:Transcript_35251/g.74373  ORF Transcript_35251/g.74373 Transcript_35251/m.74373 type:complete len:360 (+) Transcript_35251:33-1112(+)
MSGMRIVEMVKENIKPSDILTRQSFENAIKVNCAIGGSTNAVIHLLAIAGRVGVPLKLDDFDTLGKDIPTIVNLMPAGEFLMEEFYYAGGLPVVIRALMMDDDGGINNHLHADAMTVSGMTLGDVVMADNAENFDDKVILPLERPLAHPPHLAVFKGGYDRCPNNGQVNLAPNGAVMKVSAASKHLLQHSGRAVVFEDIEDYKARIDDDDLDCDENSVLVLRNCGLRGYPGMAEVGNMALPAKILKKGIEDMVRISDARMSGTAFGTCVLHVSPESAVGGIISHVRDGDVITLDVNARTISMDISEEELEQRKLNWTPPPPPQSGYARLFHNRIEGPELGADFDFLKGCRGPAVPKYSH